jgi:hypothetical protein
MAIQWSRWQGSAVAAGILPVQCKRHELIQASTAVHYICFLDSSTRLHNPTHAYHLEPSEETWRRKHEKLYATEMRFLAWKN